MAKGNDRYVPLSYRPKLPIAYHAEQKLHICYLVLSQRLALGKGVQFTDMNAAKTGVERKEGVEGLRKVDFAAIKSIYAAKGTPEHDKRQAEILVPGQIPVAAIEYVAFRSATRFMEKSDRNEPVAFVPI